MFVLVHLDYFVSRSSQSNLQAQYMKWCKETNFTSMLPTDRKAQREALQSKLLQSSLDDSVVVVERVDQVTAIPYSDETFARVAFEWLICTDQPIWALQHERYQAMIHMAARATTKVKIPGRKLTRHGIMDLYWDIMRGLKERFAVRIYS
ncbi:hypothetical protein EV360DRAFT_34556 [Lentinula raphanica]|nr:hypothetical protein EV360DRAFT_34556 [Lentinula raphanica]